MDLAILLMTISFTLMLGGIVIARDWRRSYAQAFMLMAVFITVWIGANYLTNHPTSNLELANLANVVAFVAGYATVLSGLLFTYHFPVRTAIKQLELWLVLLVSAAIIILSCTEFVAGRAYILEGKTMFTTGSGLIFYVISFVSLVGLITRNLTLRTRKLSKVKKSQARWVLFAFASSALLGLVLNAIVPLLWPEHTAESTRFGPLVTILLVGVIGYTIIRHGLFDIKLAVVRTVAYGLSIATLTALYFGLAYIISMTIFNQAVTSGVSLSPINILIALAMALTFQPIKQFFDRATNQIFFRDRYDTGELIATLARILTSTTSLRILLERAASHIEGAMKVSHSTFVVFRDGKEDTVVSSKSSAQLTKSDRQAITAYVSDKYEVQLLQEIDKLAETDSDLKNILKLLRRHGVAAILPLSDKVGYVLLGEQKGSGFAARDVRALNAISDELLIAIQNVRSIQEVRDLNMNLQQRIDAATRELRGTNEKLRALDATKDEFISMASHQLRTPLTGIKGYLSMVLEGDVGKISDKQRQMLDQAFSSSERMVRLISDFLNVSRLQTGKFVIDAHPTDLAKIVRQEVDSLKQLAESHSLQLSCSVPKSLPKLLVDEDKLRQVIMNFIDNAIYYSPSNTTIAVKLFTEGGDVVLEIHDRGMGVPLDAQKKLFTKFFRADNARKQRPDGTGVGLFLAKKVVTAMSGTIVFESREGKGSVFGFRLPLKKLRVE